MDARIIFCAVDILIKEGFLEEKRWDGERAGMWEIVHFWVFPYCRPETLLDVADAGDLISLLVGRNEKRSFIVPSYNRAGFAV